MLNTLWNAIKNFFRSRTTEENVEAFILAAEAIAKLTPTEFDDIGARKLRASKSALIIFIDSTL